MNPFKFSLVATTALMASTSLSRANVVTVTANIGAPTNWGTSTQTSGYSPTFNLSVPAFDTSLGTLTGVVVTLTDNVNGTLTLTNNGSGSTNVSAFLIDIAKTLLPGGFLKTETISTPSFSDPTLAQGASLGPSPVTASASTSKTYLSSLATFESAWSVTTGDFGSVDTTSGNGNGVAAYTDSSSLIVSAQYTYTPTPTTTPAPEPATMAILGSGLAGLGLLRRRRK